MEVHERIKFLRIQNGFTQEELGKLIGIKKAAIQKYESGVVKNIKRSNIKILADALGVTPSYLMGWDEFDDKLNSPKLANEVKVIEEIKEHYGSESVELLQLFTKLNSNGKDKVLDYIYDLADHEKYLLKNHAVQDKVQDGSR